MSQDGVDSTVEDILARVKRYGVNSSGYPGADYLA